MTFGYVFESTCTDNYLLLTSGNGVVLWSATYTPFTGATINIPAGLTDLKFVMKSVGPMVFVTDVFVTQGPCGRGKLRSMEDPLYLMMKYFMICRILHVCRCIGPDTIQLSFQF